jgi:uncharacterized protein YggE
MRKILFTVLILGCLACALPARAADTERTISTTGEATVYVVPDRVVVNFGIETFNADLDAAKDANEKAGAKLMQAILGLNIEKKDIATDHLQVEIHRRYSDGRYVDIDGYFVRRGYAVTLKDVKLFEKLVDAALKNGANQIQGVNFSTTDLRQYRDQARQMAIKAAKEKAVALAKDLDCAVGKPKTISEGGGSTYFGGYRWDRGGSIMSQNAVQSVSGAPDTGEALPLGQIAVSASISTTFVLE